MTKKSKGKRKKRSNCQGQTGPHFQDCDPLARSGRDLDGSPRRYLEGGESSVGSISVDSQGNARNVSIFV